MLLISLDGPQKSQFLYVGQTEYEALHDRKKKKSKDTGECFDLYSPLPFILFFFFSVLYQTIFFPFWILIKVSLSLLFTCQFSPNFIVLSII